MTKRERDKMFLAGFVRGLETAARYPATIAACSRGIARERLIESANRIFALAKEAAEYKFPRRTTPTEP